jgi:hypothetical protein
LINTSSIDRSFTVDWHNIWPASAGTCRAHCGWRKTPRYVCVIPDRVPVPVRLFVSTNSLYAANLQRNDSLITIHLVAVLAIFYRFVALLLSKNRPQVASVPFWIWPYSNLMFQQFGVPSPWLAAWQPRQPPQASCACSAIPAAYTALRRPSQAWAALAGRRCGPALAGQAWRCGRGPCLRLGRSATSFHAFPFWRAHCLQLAPLAQAAQAAVDLMD